MSCDTQLMASPEDFPGRILHQACIFNNSDLLADLLNGPERTNINAPDAAGRSVVYSAVSNDSISCLHLLLEEGADPDVACERFNGQTPLHQAALNGKEDLVEILLNYSADFLKRDNTGNLPLDLARQMSHSGCVNLLKDAQEGRDKVALRARGEAWRRRQAATPLSRRNAVIFPNWRILPELEKELLDVANCDINKCDEMAAILNAEKVKALVNMDIDKHSILYRACTLRRGDLVRWLIKYGATPGYDKTSKQTPLYAACRADCVEAVTVLLQKFPNLLKVVTSQGAGKLHCLHFACQNSLELLKVLVEHPYREDLLEYQYTADRKYCYRSAFDVNVPNFTLWSPLYFATAANKPDIVRYLLQYETQGYPLSSSFRDLSESDIPQALASIEEYVDAFQPVKNIRPVDASQAAVDSTTPLHHAARSGYLEVAQLLIQHGADINQVCEYQEGGSANVKKYTPLLFAVKQGDKEMISLLLKSGVRDDNSEVLLSCFHESSQDLVTFILKHKAYADHQHKMSMAASRRPGMDEADAHNDMNSAVGINWHGVKLAGQIADEWIYESSLYINPSMSRASCLDAITVLDVSSTGIISLPAIVFTLHHLVLLNAESNKLSALPNPELWKIPNLKEVCLNRNNFDTIPVGLLQLPVLEKLSICENEITSVPFLLWTAPKLVDVNLAHNKISKVAHSPAEDTAAPMRRARTFTHEWALVDMMDGAIIENRPCERTHSGSSGKSMVINRWSSVLEVVEAFESSSNPDATLATINLSHNRLKQVPQGLACLAPKLQRLNLSHNSIDEMGLTIMYPVALTALNLSYNKLKRMATDELEDMARWHSAKPCYAPPRKDNKHRDSSVIPEVNTPRNRASTGSSSSLVSLSTLCRHRSLRLDNLTSLNVSHNKLTEVIFTSSTQVESDTLSEKSSRSGSVADSGLLYPKVTQLDLSHNEISSIPPIVAEHTDLTQLNLRCNLIRDLPPEMGLLKSLWNMELSGCPLEGPLAEKIEMKARTSDIIGFLNSVLKHAKPYASMKLMIVGQANIGKTTLLGLLRREGQSTNPFRHFNQRVTNSSAAGDSRTGDTVSTVGVDIGDLTFDKRGGKGKVMFKTWDFGGQEEYYSTHQYFLSRRSLYLVLYKLTDGKSAIDTIKQWLVNIQTRSPGAPVIIVGSHFDQFKKGKDWKQKLNSLKDYIKQKFMVPEPATMGLPNVKDMIEVSKNNYNIAELANMIHREAWALKAPGSLSMPLLEQRIPAIYIRLEQVVGQLSADRLVAKKNPVLNAQQYRSMVSEQIKFRDSDELNQATQFLHDNGVLLHYQDTALSDLYFLDPQWLCDMLAHVITIKPINGFVKSGIMKVEHLEQLFRKSAIFQSDDLQTYIISLLSKFELALKWDENHLLLPSLLPSEEEKGQQEVVKVPLCPSSPLKRSSTIKSMRLKQRRAVRVSRSSSMTEHHVDEGNSTFYVENSSNHPPPLQNGVEIPLHENNYMTEEAIVNGLKGETINEGVSSQFHESIRRIYLLSYIPSGFWPRLISRIYSDQTISILTEFLFDVPPSYADLLQSPSARSWQCWKTGLALQNMTSDLLKVRQVYKGSEGLLPYYSSKLMISADGDFKLLNMQNMNVLEVEIPDNRIEISQPNSPDVIEHSTRRDVRAKLLAKVVEHIETLLEDWYPDLGDKFQQNTRGDYLVRRLVICPSCVEIWLLTSSTRTSSLGAADEHFALHSKKKDTRAMISCYPVEELLTRQYDKHVAVTCKSNHTLSLSRYAPDLVFADVYNTMSIDDVYLGQALGKGAFGVVFLGYLKKESYYKRNVVAVKTLQPHDPGPDGSESLRRQFEQAARKWADQTERNVFAAYCNARQEINILNLIQHSNIVPLVGVLLEPLSIILERAPLGSLQDTISDYARASVKLPFLVIQRVATQVASALSYLHNEPKLIYRDLKGENVLVWAMPAVYTTQMNHSIEVRLADFGVSRAVSNCTAKGNWGTPGYMAPEIIEFQGREEYTEKVDCYSFGSFLYELITLKRPFHNGEGNINSYVIAGKRPAISNSEVIFPSNMLDLMTLCWAHEPNARPSADRILDIVSHPHFSCLQEVVRAEANIDCVTSSCAVEKSVPIDMNASVMEVSFEQKAKMGYEVYVVGGVRSGAGWQGIVNKLEYSSNGQYLSTEAVSLVPDAPLLVACCAVESSCWLADTEGTIYVLMPNDLPLQVLQAASPLEHGRIRQLLYAREACRVYCLLHKGLLIEYDSVTLEIVCQRQICDTFSSTMVQIGDCLWVGLRDAYIKVLPIHELGDDYDTVSDWMSSEHAHTHLINHYNPVEQHVDTAFLVTDDDRQTAWSNVYPGSCVYRWDTKERAIEGSCDIADVISSNPGQDPVSFPSTQLTALVHHCSKIIAASTSGFLVILDGATLDPLVCLNPHSMASYRTLYAVQHLPGCGRYLTLGVGYKDAIACNETSKGRPPLHILTWYINPSESI